MAIPNNPVATSISTSVNPRFCFPSLINIILNPVLCDIGDVGSVAVDRPALPLDDKRQLPHAVLVTGVEGKGGDGNCAIVNDTLGVGGGSRIEVVRESGRDETVGPDLIPTAKADGFGSFQHDLGGALIFPEQPRYEEGVLETTHQAGSANVDDQNTNQDFGQGICAGGSGSGFTNLKSHCP